MTSENPAGTESATGTPELKDILAQAIALADRVEKMPDGPLKEKLRTALAEIRVSAGDSTSASVHAD